MALALCACSTRSGLHALFRPTPATRKALTPPCPPQMAHMSGERARAAATARYIERGPGSLRTAQQRPARLQPPTRTPSAAATHWVWSHSLQPGPRAHQRVSWRPDPAARAARALAGAVPNPSAGWQGAPAASAPGDCGLMGVAQPSVVGEGATANSPRSSDDILCMTPLPPPALPPASAEIAMDEPPPPAAFVFDAGFCAVAQGAVRRQGSWAAGIPAREVTGRQPQR